MLPQEKEFPASSSISPSEEPAVLRAFLDDAPSFFVIKDFEGRYVYVNQFVAESYKRLDLLGKTSYDLMPPLVAEATRAKEREVFTTGSAIQTREVFPGLNGKILSASLLRFPIETPSRRLLAVIGLDVTELARAESRQAALLDLATDAIHVRDLGGFITYWNRAAEGLYGWTRAEAQGRNALEILFRQDRKSIAPLLEVQERLLHDESWSGELTKVTRNGEQRIVASRWTLLRDHNGHPDAILVIDSDITKKKEIEQQLLRAVRMDTIGALAGAVAHDLNNMLMPILMGAAVIRKRVQDPQLANTVNHLEESANKAAALVRQILTFIRGSQDAKEVISGERLLTDLQKFLHGAFAPSVRIEGRVGEKLLPVFCRPSEIHQVLVNLCVNARDAMGDSGSLVVELKNVAIDHAYAQMSLAGARPGQYVAFAIKDTGPGIPPEQLEAVFEPYFTTKEPGKGTGLGLANAMTVVREHGGFITVDSTVGGGTTFTVFLPIADGAPEELASIGPIPAGAGETVLVVDDEGAVLEVVRETLEAFDYHVVTATDGSEAIALLATNSAVRIVVTDVAMPIVDGIALAKFVRRAHPDLKVIIASGTNDSQRRVATEHADAYLEKPYTADTLLRSVALLLTTPS